ncbi:hypothetical protein F7725_008246 [Dissostichus mawsoni]|uniref:Nesprin-1 spectrin repeats region domain-containing protein n=1 Tax=Dissostichus mawsoni TaxID=36200 RepID=A0A7J5Y7H2_DISMA|nr:hypothetical protein F7725_008246 [Dissostichus mawsoni]
MLVGAGLRELLEGWDSTEGESYSERYHVFQTFLVSFNEQRRPIMPLLGAMRRTPKLSDEQRALREAWDSLTEKLREYKVELDMSVPAPLDTVARWLLKTEKALNEEEGDPQDHGRAADEAKETQEILKVCLEEMPQQVKTFQSFQNLDEYANMMVPSDKMDELKRRFTSVRVTAKYHGIKLEYREHRHTVLDLLGQIRTKLRVWKRPYISPEAVRVLLQEWHQCCNELIYFKQDLVNTQELPSLLEAALHKLKQVSERYSSKSALGKFSIDLSLVITSVHLTACPFCSSAADYHTVSQQVTQLEEDTAIVLEEVTTAKSTMGRVLSAWDSYSDGFSSLQAWLEQGSASHSHGPRPEVTPDSMAEWGSKQAHLNEVGNFLLESTDPHTSRSLAEELRRLNMQWAEFFKRTAFVNIQPLIREATLLLKEPLETMAGPLRTYRKRIQFMTRKIKEVDLEALAPSPECPAEQLQKLKFAIPEVMQTLFEAEQVCAELQHSVSGLDSRLAELLHWESEARELYQLLRAAERQPQRGQNPQASVLISRGLQLEGQVVTEEQDLQMMVMTSQKNSPMQYLHASAMQDREAVGMLSSLGARRERSRSPPEGSPPSKVFKQAKEKPQHLRQSESVSWPTKQPEKELVQSHGTFVPKIVVQEYRETKPHPQGTAQIQSQTKTMVQSKSQPVVQLQVQSTSVSHSTTDGEQQLWTMSETKVSQGQSQTQGLLQPHGLIKTQSLTQVQTQSQTYVSAGSQMSLQPQGVAHGLTVAQVQALAQVRPSSPMQAPCKAKFSILYHPTFSFASWAPVRTPSPKPPTPSPTQTHSQSMAQFPTYPQSMPQPQIHPQSMPQPQIHPHLKSILSQCPSLKSILSQCPSLKSIHSQCPILKSILSQCPSLKSIHSQCPILKSILSQCPCLKSILSQCPSLKSILSPCPSPQHSLRQCPSLKFILSPCPSLKSILRQCPRLRPMLSPWSIFKRILSQRPSLSQQHRFRSILNQWPGQVMSILQLNIKPKLNLYL